MAAPYDQWQNVSAPQQQQQQQQNYSQQNFPQQYEAQYAQQQQQQQQYSPPSYTPQAAGAAPGMPGYGSPQFQLAGMDGNVVTQISLAYGAQALNVGQNYLQQNVNRFISVPQLRHYFQVDNAYVGRKLMLILFPFRHKDWVRKYSQSEPETSFALPRNDINAPDMYIPSMAMISYVLLVGIAMGLQHKFTPDVLGLTASSCIGVMVLELLFIKLGCFLFNLSNEVVILDLVAYIGYKYVVMIATLAADMMFGTGMKTIVFCYTSCALILFLLRTMRNNMTLVDHSNEADTSTNPHGKRRNYFLFVIAGLQVIEAFFLTRI